MRANDGPSLRLEGVYPADLGEAGEVGVGGVDGQAVLEGESSELDFLGGIVFHTGPSLLELDERVVAAPIAAIWS